MFRLIPVTPEHYIKANGGSVTVYRATHKSGEHVFTSYAPDFDAQATFRRLKKRGYTVEALETVSKQEKPHASYTVD